MTTSQAIKCPKCGEYTCPSFCCLEQNCCGECVDIDICEDCDDADNCTVQSVGAAIQEQVKQIAALHRKSINPTTASAVQNTMASGLPQSKAGWDDLGY